MIEEEQMKTAHAASPRHDQPSCQALTQAGKPCQATPMADGWCCHHSPRYSAEDRSSWGRRGALAGLGKRATRRIEDLTPTVPAALVPAPGAPSFATADAVRGYLEECARKVESNEIAPSQAGAIAQLAGLALKLVELQNERDLIDIELRRAEEDAQDRPVIRFER